MQITSKHEIHFAITDRLMRVTRPPLNLNMALGAILSPEANSMTRLKHFFFSIVFVIVFVLGVVVLVGDGLRAQEFVVESRVKFSGTVGAISSDQITLLDAQENIVVFKIQRKGSRALSIDRKLLNSPATMTVTGQIDAAEFLRPSMVVKFDVALRKDGRSEGDVSALALMSADELEVDSDQNRFGYVKELSPSEETGFAKCEVVGLVQKIRKGRVTLLVAESPYASKNRVRVELSKDAVVTIARDDLKLVQTGDSVASLDAFKLTSGHLVVKSIEIKLQNEREIGVVDSFQMDAKYSLLSDEPAQSRDVRSQHFLLHTDVSDRQGQMLLDKLETMIELVSQYYRRPSKGLIECYVVRDLQNWPAETFPEGAIEKIREPAGVTITRVLGKQRRTIVFSCDQHQTVQHEAIHAYCQQTFGSTGPVWYAEGMAEMGAYWKEGQLEVDIQPGVIRYLTNASPKKMLDIVAAGQVTGDSWQAYAWRWALCHLLANNPNYSKRLKGLGVAMMSGRSASFEATYGDVARHISFEYDQFVKNFGNGYRADLAAWQWDVKPKKLFGKPATMTVKAKRGWQATGVIVEQENSYDLLTQGTWQIAEAGQELSGDGNSADKGKLIGAVFSDFELSPPFELGAKSTFVAPQSGHLFVRCRDAWTELSENSGELKVTLVQTRSASK